MDVLPTCGLISILDERIAPSHDDASPWLHVDTVVTLVVASQTPKLTKEFAAAFNPRLAALVEAWRSLPTPTWLQVVAGYVKAHPMTDDSLTENPPLIPYTTTTTERT